MVSSAGPDPILDYVFPSFRLKQRYIVGPFPGSDAADTFHPFGQKCDHVVVNLIDFFSQQLYFFRKPRRPIGYPVPRADSHCWFALSGLHAAEMFAKICGVDLRAHRFAEGAIAQTSVARMTGSR